MLGYLGPEFTIGFDVINVHIEGNKRIIADLLSRLAVAPKVSWVYQIQSKEQLLKEAHKGPLGLFFYTEFYKIVWVFCYST